MEPLQLFAVNDKLLFTDTPEIGSPCSLPLSEAGANFLNTLTQESTGLLGTAATGVTATEYGNGFLNVTKLTLNGKTGGLAFPAIAGGAALGVGKLIYTFPAGDIMIIAAGTKSLALTEDDGNITANDPDVGIGTVIATGAVSVLGGTATFENILTGQTSVNLAVTNVLVTGQPIVIASAAAHTVHLNAAASWAASGEDDMSATGEIVLVWVKL